MNLVYNAPIFKQALVNSFALKNGTVKDICLFTLQGSLANLRRKMAMHNQGKDNFLSCNKQTQFLDIFHAVLPPPGRLTPHLTLMVPSCDLYTLLMQM